MDINKKPTVLSTSSDDYVFISQDDTLRRVSIPELVEFLQSVIVVDDVIMQTEIDALWDLEDSGDNFVASLSIEDGHLIYTHSLSNDTDMEIEDGTNLIAAEGES